jgi:hypothetical protein
VIGRLQVSLHDQVAEADVTKVPLSSSEDKDPDTPVALFQLLADTTPALSPAPIAVPLPTKLMLMIPDG